MRAQAYTLPLIVALAAAFASAGCRTEPIPAKATRPEPPPREERRGLPPDKRPSMAGEYLVYPLQWRRADEVADELYHLLFPKYGPYLSIIPDQSTNSLLIYLPPRSSRYRAEEGGEKAPGTEQY